MTRGDRLDVSMYDRRVGTLERARDNRLSFVYDQGWIDAEHTPQTHMLSISLPMLKKEHGPEATEAFIAGLLPEHPLQRRHIASVFGVPGAEESDFELLRHIGRDCAGAVVFSDPEDHYAQLREPAGYTVLSETELADLLEDLPRRPLADDPALGTRISLAGVHDKMAVLVVGGKIALARNGFPTSHVLKVGMKGFADSIRTEHFCLRLAAACGVRVPQSQINQAGDKIYMRIARYDRTMNATASGAVLNRLHQEDICQALGILPSKKLEHSGGPSWPRVMDLMKFMDRPAVDQMAVLDRAIFQYLSGNPGGHGKNYSIRYAPDGRMALSPLYDLNNHAALATRHASQPSMAMSIGRSRDDHGSGEFLRPKVTRDHFVELAQQMGQQAGFVLKRLDELALTISRAAVTLREEMRHTLAETALLDVIVDDVTGRADAVRAGRPEPSPRTEDATRRVSEFKMP